MQNITKSPISHYLLASMSSRWKYQKPKINQHANSYIIFIRKLFESIETHNWIQNVDKNPISNPNHMNTCKSFTNETIKTCSSS